MFTLKKVLFLLLPLLMLFFVAQVFASHVTPVLVTGNPSCTSLGFSFGFKPQPEPPPSGTYTLPDGVNTVTITSDGTYFDWSSTLAMDAVIAKGGPNANVYNYAPEATGDTGLSSPINPNNNKPFAISHIEFCYDYELRVSKTATTTFTRTFQWTIQKSVTPATWNLFSGDSGTSQYTVQVTKDSGTDSNHAVTGTITIDNPSPLNVTLTGVNDNVNGTPASVICPSFSIAPWGTLQCTYSLSLPDGTNRLNTVNVTTSTPGISGGSATADVIFGAPTTVVNDSISVQDSVQGSLGTFNASASIPYSRTFTCDADQGTHNNTATIVETGQSANASVTVNCYELEVTKDAATSFKREWDWTISKSGNQTALTLSPGQVFLVNYSVTVNASKTESEWAVSGSISVYNPAPVAATLNSVADVVSPGIVANVNCGVTFPYILSAGGTLPCTYSAALPDASDRTNTATATLQNYSYDSAGNATGSGTTDFSHTVNVNFAGATVNEVDECVDVSDSYAGVLGTVCAGVDTLPKTFTYSRNVGPFTAPDQCGENRVTNVAQFVTNDTGTTGSDDHTVVVTVPCNAGCTLTQGYWKTHSEFGPAPYDNTWAMLPNGASTPFFLSGKTYYQVLQTAPAGNVYYILAHQYIAAQLNMLNGASVPASVQTAFNAATTLFTTKTPAQAAALKGSAKQTWTNLAAILDGYNNGLTGPGHCSE